MKPIFKSVAMPLAALTVTSALASESNAAMVVLDFEQFAGDIVGEYGVTVAALVQEKGFTFTDTDPNSNSPGFGIVGDQSIGYTGSATLSNGFLDTTTLVKDDGTAFDLISIDLEKFGTEADDVTFYGFTAVGQNVSQTFSLPGNPDFILDTYNFSDDFNDVVSVSWTLDTDFSFQADNVTINTVPLPGAGLLLVSGLAGLGASRFYKNSIKPEATL